MKCSLLGPVPFSMWPAPLCLSSPAACSLLTSYGFSCFPSLYPLSRRAPPSGEVTEKLIWGKAPPTRSLCSTCSLHLFPRSPPSCLPLFSLNVSSEHAAALCTMPLSPLRTSSQSRSASSSNYRCAGKGVWPALRPPHCCFHRPRRAY